MLRKLEKVKVTGGQESEDGRGERGQRSSELEEPILLKSRQCSHWAINTTQRCFTNPSVGVVGETRQEGGSEVCPQDHSKHTNDGLSKSNLFGPAIMENSMGIPQETKSRLTL